jgi:(p)ppGpp synthase/HD superfamily hydrolase
MLVQRAEEFAHLVHRNQQYGELPYVDHLKEVYLTLLDFGIKDEVVLAAAWLHDSIEDTETTYETLEIQFGKEVAELVQAVTNEKGSNRKEILEKTAPKIRDNKSALILKLADRIVNTEFSIDNNEKLYKMYEKEFPRFKTLLLIENERNETILKLWKHLSNLYNPWVRLAGKYEDDPYYDDVLVHIEEYRKELDEEVGRYYDDCYKIVEERMYDQ